MNNFKTMALGALCLMCTFLVQGHKLPSDLRRVGVPKRATGSPISAELVVAREVWQQKKSRSRAQELLDGLENVQVVHSAEVDGVTLVALTAHGTLNIDGLPAYNTESEEDVPVLVAFDGDKGLWITAGESASIVDHVPLLTAQDGGCVLTLWVKDSNAKVEYSFGDTTIVIPESDVNGAGIMVKVDVHSGTVASIDAYPIVLPRPVEIACVMAKKTLPC